MEVQSKAVHTSSIVCAPQPNSSSRLNNEQFRGLLLSYREHIVQKCLCHYAPSMELFKDFIPGNPRQRLSTKGKSISFAFLEILDLAMERKEDWERAQHEHQEKISKYKTRARRKKIEEKNSSRVVSIKFWGPQKPWYWQQNSDSSPKKNAYIYNFAYISGIHGSAHHSPSNAYGFKNY